ncbi:MAG TPA: glucose 1-dehydrogenase [Gammaproteobacteria bacterium]|jgi:NAD(P)-dependent dehydrogenase (short-subunit alcohol dehydrogenase family)|nr:glucose 1-dehydrogenase [Gammaproteobacteria bacterium]HBW99543.1 glucose 1-dehydrogenase [Gammaproteobacteria bacterium]|tara:strand:+ start:2084 stop:2797 length:714 start_codon:yes stop_codon:yes gene_type:complete
MKTAIVSGVGPLDGLGAQLCVRFARLGLHVLVAGRTQAKLDAVVDAIGGAGGSAQAVIADATVEADTERLFEIAGSDLTVAIYNTGNNTPGRIADMSAEYFENSWRVCCFGGFLFGRAAINAFAGNGGTLIFTGASASLRGRENFGAFNSSKGALRNLAQAMAKEYGRDGVHVGHVVVDGPIGGEKIKQGLPEYAAKLGDEGMIDIDGIVDGYVYLYQQPRQAWSFELDVRTSLEKW